MVVNSAEVGQTLLYSKCCFC